MKYKFQINKKNFDVEVANHATFHSETDIKVNKKIQKVLIGKTDGDEVHSMFIDNKLYQVEIIKDSDGYPTGIFVNGEFFPSSLLKIDKLFYYKEKKIKAKRSGIVMSFIPGSIRKIYFNVGDFVKENDIILIHEAMKMENEIRSPISGVIKSIGVKEGENILAGHNLLVVE